jgi:hypothetical protein
LNHIIANDEDFIGCTIFKKKELVKFYHVDKEINTAVKALKYADENDTIKV